MEQLNPKENRMYQEPLDVNKTINCTIGRSDIDGVGVVAVRDITKGQRLYIHLFWEEKRIWLTPSDYVKLFDEISKKLAISRYPTIKDGSLFPHPQSEVNLVSFMNHSDNPNYDNVTDTALRDIKTGEEVTEHYGKYRDDVV